MAARQWVWQYLTSKDQRSWWWGKEQMRGQKGLPKPTEPSEKTRWDGPNPTRMQTSAMFKSDILPTRQWWWFHFSPPFWWVPLYFYTSLKRIPYACHINRPSDESILVHLTSPRKEKLEHRHYDWIQCHQGLTSLKKEELSVFSCLESLKRQRKSNLQQFLFVNSSSDPKR